MTTLDLFNILEEEITEEITGILSYDGDTIKWEYDGLNDLHLADDLDSYLEEIAEEDKGIIEELFNQNNLDQFIMTNIEINDTFVMFYIEE